MVQEYGFGTMIMVNINDSVRGGHYWFFLFRLLVVGSFSKYTNWYSSLGMAHRAVPTSRWIRYTLRCRYYAWVPFAFSKRRW